MHQGGALLPREAATGDAECDARSIALEWDVWGPHSLDTAGVASRTALLLTGQAEVVPALGSPSLSSAHSLGEGRCVDAWSQNRGARCVGVGG